MFSLQHILQLKIDTRAMSRDFVTYSTDIRVANALDEPAHLRRLVRPFGAQTYKVVIKIKAQTKSGEFFAYRICE